MQIAHGIAAVGEERHALIHLQALPVERFIESSFRLFVIVSNEGEALFVAIGCDAFADDNFKPARFPVVTVAPPSSGFRATRVDIPAIDADNQRGVGLRQTFPLGNAAMGEHGLFFAQFVVECKRSPPLGNLHRLLVTVCGGVWIGVKTVSTALETC